MGMVDPVLSKAACRCVHCRDLHLGPGQRLYRHCGGIQAGLHCGGRSSSTTAGFREFPAGYSIQTRGDPMLWLVCFKGGIC